MPEFDKIPRDRLEQWLKEIADSGRGSGAYAVKYTTQQLSSSQKEQARTNIGLEKSTDIEADHEDVSKYVVPNAIYSWVLEKLSALINPKGNWDSTVTYHKGDMVMVSAVLYLCITENASGVIGTSPVSDTTNWFFISKGPYDTNIVVDSETGAKTCNCVRNTEYRYTNASGITSLTLASLTNPNANEEYLFEVIFKSGTVATTFVNSANIYFTGEDSLLGIFTPVESKTYQLSAWWNGMSWQGVTRGVYIYSVENVLTQCTTSNIATQAISGSSYTATITPTVDYAINSYSVYMGGVDITATAYNNGIITIAEVTGNIVITIVAVPIYSVENVLTQCTTSNIATQAISGSSYTATITPTVDYAINSYSVYMGGVDITATAYNNGIITIAEVTGNIVITIVAVPIYSVENVLTQCTTSNIATQAISGSSYTATITPTVDYAINSYSVYMGGVDITATAYNNGIISISSVTGDVVITATAESQARLSAPVIDLTGSILSWTSVTNATGYSIRCDGEEVATSTGLSIDISTLFSEDGAYAMTVVATASGYRESNPSNSKTYLIGVAPIYGVSWINDSTKTMNRTDDAVNLSYAINSSSGSIASDFNEVFPWNETVVETINGNKFLKFPEMWFRVGKDANNCITDVAVSKQQGPTGNWYKVDPFYYGCYGASSDGSVLESVTGVTRLHSQTRAVFRSRATATGTGYQQLDLYHRTVTLFLWWIEWATKDSASIMTGKTQATGDSMCNTGGTDAVTTPSGFNTTTEQMRYHYMEDFVGNFFEFIDGSVGTGSSGGVQYVTANPAYFGDTSANHNTLAFNSPTTSGSCLAAMGWDDNNPFLCLPKETVSNSNYHTYFCDLASTSNSIVLYCGAYWDGSSADYGVSCFYRGTASSSYYDIGGRLLYKPWCRGL